MTAELQVTVHGPADAMSAGDVVAGLRNMLDLVRALSGAADDATSWRFTHLGLGSVEYVLQPLDDELGQVPLRVVEGFEDAEAEPGVPSEWVPEAVEPARLIADRLGGRDRGMTLRLLVEGEVRREVQVTHQASLNLRSVAQVVRQESIGSVIGKLDSITVHGQYSANLWMDRGGQRVQVRFRPEQLDNVKAALGARVEVSGRLRREPDGRVASVTMTGIETLVEAPGSLADIPGSIPNVTSGMSVTDYLEHIRGEA